MRTFSLTSLAVVTFLLVGCGYQLRGSADLPDSMGRVYIDASRGNSPLIREVHRALTSNGSQVVSVRRDADVVLNIMRDELRRRVLTVSETTRVQEFMLDYDVEFRVLDAQGKHLIPSQKLELHQAYEYSETRVLGKSGQEDILRAQLQREMAALILDRIAAAQRD